MIDADPALADRRARLYAHPLYATITDERALRRFMRAHVFAVWDFQSLLAALRRDLTGVSVPWRPTPDREARRLINEIALDEESAPHLEGGYASHFELYLDAMRRAGADCQPIDALLARVEAGEPVRAALRAADWPPGVAAFVDTTFAIIQDSPLHARVAAFACGREDIIPRMFQALVARLAAADPARWGLTRHYLDEHIHHDEERHGPMARALLARVCGGDPKRIAEARAAAMRALDARLALWDTLAASM